MRGEGQMAHLTNYKSGGAVAILRHDERSVEDKTHSRKNECIQADKTHLNYQLAPPRKGKLTEHIQAVCEANDVRLNNRKDLNIMSSWVVSLPADVKQEEQQQFFQETHNFLENRYGKEFVLSSMVHMDETTPHLHFCFIPVGIDNKKEKTVSSKLVCTRRELQTFHKDLSKHLEKSFGRELGIENGATLEGNKAIDELKRQSATERLNEATQKASKIVSKAVEQAKGVQEDIAPIRAEYEARRAFIEQSVKDSEISVMYPEWAKVKKPLIGKETVTVPKEKWEAKHISANQISAIEKQREAFDEEITKFSRTKLSKKIDDFKLEILGLKQELRQAKAETIAVKTQAQNQAMEHNTELLRIKTFFKRHPEVERAYKNEMAQSKSLHNER
jgi:hypothetical protein